MAKEKQEILFELDDNIGDTIDRLSTMADGLMKTNDAMEALAESGELGMATIQDAIDTLDVKHLKAIEDVDFGKMIEGVAPGLNTLEEMNATLMQSTSDYHAAKIRYEREGTDVARQEAERAKKIHEDKIKAVQQIQKQASQKLQEQAREAKRVFVDQREELHKYMEEEFPSEVGKGIGGAVQSALNADPAGMIEGVVSALGTGVTGAMKKGQQALEERQMKAGKLSGGGGGGGGAAGAMEGAEGMQEMSKSMKGAAGKMAKFAGAATAAVGGIALIVKLLMDSEAQTIELNEALLESTSILELGAGNVEDGVKNMEDLRSAATDTATQIRLGMDPQEIMKATAALQEQNIDLRRLSNGYSDMGDAAVSTIQDIRFASMNLGTDTQQVTEFVGNLHNVNSVAMADVKDQLDLVVHSAQNADMSTEEFFSTVNQISGQMGLYNFRLEDTTALMGTLSHLMDPEIAQEFTEEFTTGMKDMNHQERMRLMLLSGQQDTMERLNAENDRMWKRIGDEEGNLSESLRATVEDIGIDELGNIETVDDLREGLAEVGAASTEHARVIEAVRGQNSELADNLSDASQMAADLERGGLHTMDAMRHLQAMDHLDMEIEALENVAGPIGQIPGIMADSLGVDERQLEVMRRVDEQARAQLGEINAVEERLLEDNATPDQGREAVQALGEKLDMSLKWDAENNRILDEQDNELKDRSDIMRHLSEDQLDAIEDENMTMEQAAREQVRATQSIADVMQAVIADLLQEISGGVSFISDLLMQAPFIDGASFDFRQKMHNEQLNLAEERRDLEQDLVDLQDDVSDAQESGDDDLVRELREQESVLGRQVESLGQQESAAEKASALVGGGHDIEIVERARQQADDLGLDFAQHGDLLADQVSQLDRKGYHAYEDVLWDGGGPEDSDVNQFRQEMEVLRDRDIRSDMAEALEEQNFEDLNPEEQRKLLDEISSQVAEDTVLDDKSSRDLANDLVQAQAQHEARKELFDMFRDQGMGTDLATRLTQGRMDTETRQLLEQTDDPQRVLQETRRVRRDHGLTGAQDARILSGGFAPHLFAPGDMIVKADEIADTRTGRAGQFAPDLLSQMGTGSSSGGGRSIVMNTTINASGNAGEVENALLRAYDMIRRREMGES